MVAIAMWKCSGFDGPRTIRVRPSRLTDRGELMLEDKAKELGRLIGQSPEYQGLKRSSDALNEDREAVALLQQMEKLRGEAQQFIQRGENPTEEMEKQLDELLEKIQGQSVYQRAVAAQENFDK